MSDTRILRWESTQRYYVARVETDLLGDTVLALAWGGLHNRKGNISTQVVQDEVKAAEAISDLHARRTRRNYQLVDDRVTQGN